MPISRHVVDALSEKDREELACWAAMADMKPEEYLEACIKRGHEILGSQILETPTYLRESYGTAKRAAG